MPNQPIRIGIVAGEASGDILAAGMLSHIRQAYPDAIIEGIAGPKMLEQGCKSLFDMEELSVMGLVEVLSRIRRLLHIRKTVLNHFLSNPPDVFIGVDAPDFNLPLEKKLKANGIKTVHYVSPTVWAWRENRIYGIAEATNLVLSVLPFEKRVYDKHGFPCQFVGHTMADDVPLEPDRNEAREHLGIPQEAEVVAVLPGSRGTELKMLLPPFLDTIRQLRKESPERVFVIPAANETRYKQIDEALRTSGIKEQVMLVLGQSRQAMIASNVVLLASGTATLEAMLCKRPMVVAYRLNWLTHQMMKKLYKAKFFALPNLLADREIVPELLQEDVSSEVMVPLLNKLLSGEQKQDIACFHSIHLQLKCHADKQAADSVLNLIHE
ncbi:lipid-A-disaccharide synthase [Aestuariibacter sp. AA17]|uniref:Lipid-A-disaccharide synthase n=1 Tax=Fluctibacter corallii TaxID=2984329 RepID=A0ABT3A8T5_9ALTE|nr:lipid-A-disaccharide synthase [Aestuariibacter sp. AA17]MCV2885002.1 lipid-A-disaccharide synthase [Aestuariibacter sp. AA17]